MQFIHSTQKWKKARGVHTNRDLEVGLGLGWAPLSKTFNNLPRHRFDPNNQNRSETEFFSHSNLESSIQVKKRVLTTTSSS